MNLLKDAWVPVKRGGVRAQITLKELLCTDQRFELSHPRDDMELAALQLLVCLTQCMLMPENRKELLSRIKNPLPEDEYDRGVAPYVPWFSLDDPKYPFMQDVEARKEVTTGIQKLFPGMPEGNGSATLFVGQDEIISACPSCTAIALFNQATCAPSFGGGTKAPLRGSAPITVFVFDPSLRKMVWKNILDTEWASKKWVRADSKEDKPVWIDKLKRNSVINTTSIGPMRGLFWQPAYLCIHWERHNTPSVCPCCGSDCVEDAKIFTKNKFPYQLSGQLWQHPHSPYLLNEKTNEFEILSYNKNVGLPLWSRLCDMFPVKFGTLSRWSLPVERYTELRSPGEVLPLVVGGYRNKQASILERHSATVSIGAGWIQDDEKLQMLHSMVQNALAFRECLRKKSYAFGKDIDQSSSIPGGIANEVDAMFFQDTESTLQQAIMAEPVQDIFEKTATVLQATCLKIFDDTAEQFLCNAKALKAYYHNRFMLQSALNRLVQAQRPIEL